MTCSIVGILSLDFFWHSFMTASECCIILPLVALGCLNETKVDSELGTFCSCSRKLLGNLRCGTRLILGTVVIPPSGTGALALTGIRTSPSVE
jgi:hypothetical protein